jgi:heptaprenyl diphosphate synthase
MLSDAQPEHVEVLDRFGEALGLGFQLSDDIMDLVSSELELGKEPAVDLKLGVYTLPVLHAISHGSRREELSELLSARPLEDDALERAIGIVRSDGSLDHARAAVTLEVRKAKDLGARLPAGVARTALINLADFIAVRCGAQT